MNTRYETQITFPSLLRWLFAFILIVPLFACKSNAAIQQENLEKQRVEKEARERAETEAATRAIDHTVPYENVCPDFGTISASLAEPATYRNSADGARSVYVKVLGPGGAQMGLSFPEWQVTGALAITSLDQLQIYLSTYSNICGNRKPPFFNKIPATKLLAAKVARDEITKGINPSELLDQTGANAWRNGPLTRDYDISFSPAHELFNLAWLNDRENPEIYNSVKVEGDEFVFQAKRPALEAIRRQTYVLVDDVNPSVAYDFARGCFPVMNGYVLGDEDSPLNLRAERTFYLVNGNGIWQGGIHTNWWANLQADFCVKMPQEDALLFRNTPQKKRALTVLFRIRPQVTQPFTCVGAEDAYDCVRQKRNERKVKTFVAEPLRYFVKVGDNIYKNY